MSLRSFIRNWLAGDDRQVRAPSNVLGALKAEFNDVLHDAPALLRFEVIDAINGRVVKVGTYKPNPHGPDWTFHIYVMQDGESVGDAVNTLMVLKGG